MKVQIDRQDELKQYFITIRLPYVDMVDIDIPGDITIAGILSVLTAVVERKKKNMVDDLLESKIIFVKGKMDELNREIHGYEKGISELEDKRAPVLHEYHKLETILVGLNLEDKESRTKSV